MLPFLFANIINFHLFQCKYIKNNNNQYKDTNNKNNNKNSKELEKTTQKIKRRNNLAYNPTPTLVSPNWVVCMDVCKGYSHGFARSLSHSQDSPKNPCYADISKINNLTNSIPTFLLIDNKFVQKLSEAPARSIVCLQQWEFLCFYSMKLKLSKGRR